LVQILDDVRNSVWRKQEYQMPGPLSHIRVLDLSRVMAGPWATQLLADLGADVIKVERPKVGDDTRGWGPPFLKRGQHEQTTESGYFLCANRAKRSLTIDLTKPKGQELIRSLAARCDILMENFKCGALARYRLAYHDLKKVNPRLIYCSITGFGQSGPRKDDVAYDFMIQAMGGLMSITGEADDKPGGGPQKVGVPILDLFTGMYAAVAVLAALARRQATGNGEHIDLAMFDVQAAMLANQAMNYLLTGRTPRRHGNTHPNIMPQQVFRCRDGEFVLAVGNDSQYAKLCQVLGSPELNDKRFERNAGRVRHRDEMNATLARIFLEWSRSELLADLAEAGVPCGPINTIPEVLSDPQIAHRRMLVDIAHPVAGQLKQVANPMLFSEAPITYDRPPPGLGEHTSEILRELGLDPSQIDALRQDAVI
jgi:crotonobetainyl-CoA:carnitine CoA-transferase CaiB-like acyl-CoA transferase